MQFSTLYLDCYCCLNSYLWATRPEKEKRTFLKIYEGTARNSMESSVLKRLRSTLYKPTTAIAEAVRDSVSWLTVRANCKVYEFQLNSNVVKIA